MVGGKLLAAIISAKGIARFISPPHIPTMYTPHKPSKTPLMMFGATSIAGFPLTRHTSDNGMVCALKDLFFSYLCIYSYLFLVWRN